MEAPQAVNAGQVAAPNFTTYHLVRAHGRHVASRRLLNRREDEYRLYSKGIS